jgi:hypothetical protein
MRFPKGSVHLGNFKDKVILDFLAESRHATRSQLIQFVQNYYCEFNWPVFNWRIRRMVDAGLVRKQALPMLNGDVLYSITRAGFHALEGLGTFHLGATFDREPEVHRSQIPHALEVNSIRLALMGTRKLRDWTPESYIRALNLLPTSAYAKVYDAIATVLIDDNEIKFAIECERTPKTPAKYQRIREAIESERRLNAFLYLVPSYQLLYALQHAFSGTNRLVLFGMLDEFKQRAFASRVRTAYHREAPLEDMLARLVLLRPKA